MSKRRDSFRMKKWCLQSTTIAGLGMCAVFSPVGLQRATAATYYLGDVTITLQSTVGYNVSQRTAPVDNSILTANNDDGDRNFRSGVFENRIQTLEQLGISDGDYGFRGSLQAWLDTAYLGRNKNNSPSTFNSYGVSSTGFPSATIANEGRRIEMLAAFIYGAEHFNGGEQKLSWQIGRQTITWGQSLFSLNGISGLQAPVDFYEAQTLANPQAQSLFLPTGAASVAYDFGNGTQVMAYWQFEYEPDILPGVGSYFSSSDAVGPGGQRLIESPVVDGQASSIFRGPDVRPTNGLDQFGFSGYAQLGNYNLALYFVRGIPKAPGVMADAPGFFTPTANGLKIGEYRLYYAQPVNAYAASISTVLHQINLASELSFRTNQPLLSEPSFGDGVEASFGNPLYARGTVMNFLLNGIYVTPAMPVFTNGGTVEAELTFNDVLGVSHDKEVLLPGTTRGGGSFDIGWTPQYFPRSDLEVDFPVSYNVNFLGDSQFSGLNAGTATIDVGVKGIYKTNLNFGITYQRYAGPPNRQADIDRDFAQLYIQRTF
jgi:hypothetical protein